MSGYSQSNRDRYWRARALITAYKAVPCMDCGIQYPAWVMDFDHRDPKEKVFNIGSSCAKRSHAEIIAEIEKCDVVCANCHRMRTWRASSV